MLLSTCQSRAEEDVASLVPNVDGYHLRDEANYTIDLF